MKYLYQSVAMLVVFSLFSTGLMAQGSYEGDDDDETPSIATVVQSLDAVWSSNGSGAAAKLVERKGGSISDMFQAGAVVALVAGVAAKWREAALMSWYQRPSSKFVGLGLLFAAIHICID